MTHPVSEWVEKAEEDWRVALREMRVRSGRSESAICFHAQQCAEKYLKALLVEAAVAFPKIHDLPTLRSLCLPICRAVSKLTRRRMASLSRAAVEYRYPGGAVDRRVATASMKTASDVRTLARRALGL